MSVNTTQSRPRKLTRFALRHLSVMTIATTLIAWSAHSGAHNVGNYIYSDPGNRFPIGLPIRFQQGANPAGLGDNVLVRWRNGMFLHYYAFAWSNTRSIGSTIHDGQTYSIFRLGNSPTIGYLIAVKDPSSPIWLPINDLVTDPIGRQPGRRLVFDTQTMMTRPGGNCCTAGLNVRLTFIKLGNEPVPANWRTFTQNFLSFQLLSADSRRGEWEKPVNLSFSINILGQIPTCQLTGAKTQNIQLPDIQFSQLSNVGSTYPGTQTAQFPLRCDPGISVFATLTDANNTSNTGNTLTNTGSAKGVGVQLLQTSPSFSTANCAQGSPCRFGPDSSAKGNTNQWQAGPSHTNSASRNPTISFRARYVRTGALQPGDVRAVSTITFSYQ